MSQVASNLTSFFALPLPLWQQPRSFRTLTYEPRRRRSAPPEPEASTDGDATTDDVGDNTSNDGDRDDDDEDEDYDSDSTDSNRSVRASTAPSSDVLGPDETHQYRIAGLPFDRTRPGGHFPHQAPPLLSNHYSRKSTRRNIEYDLAHQSPPFFLPGAPGRQQQFHLRHLAALTTLLHRCLLQGDYARAGRAWGLLLRDGRAADVRQAGRWGIGAEILMRSDSAEGRSSDGDGSRGGDGNGGITPTGFARAKDYYERLSLQYPYRKTAPNALSPLDFSAAMFGLWIYLVQEEGRRAREGIDGEGGQKGEHDEERIQDKDGNISMNEDGSDSELEPEIYDYNKPKPKPSSTNRRRNAMCAVRSSELAAAETIALELDKLLSSPPFTDDAVLLRLRAMMALWVGDLAVASVPGAAEDEEEESDQMDIDIDGGAEDEDESGAVYRINRQLDIGRTRRRQEDENRRAEGLFAKAATRQRRGKS